MKKKKTKFVIVSDNHGDMVDWDAAKALVDFIQWYQPDEIIHAGDGFDLRSGGILADVAPTLLDLMSVALPDGVPAVADASELLGMATTHDLAEGDIVMASAVGDVADGRARTVSVPVRAGHLTALEHGAQVEVWLTPSMQGADAPGPARIVVDVATVIQAPESPDATSDTAVSLLVGDSEVGDLVQAMRDGTIDVVLIGTPDHWHAQMVIDAVHAGKDVYVEKPMAHTPDEGFRIIKVVRETKRIVQVGMQRRSFPLFQEAKRVRDQLTAAHERFTTVLEGLDAAVSVVSAASLYAFIASGLTALVEPGTLLFGAGKLEAFPVDVWILRAIARRYGLEGWRPEPLARFGRAHFGAAAGFAQQFLFAHERRAATTENCRTGTTSRLSPSFLKPSARKLMRKGGPLRAWQFPKAKGNHDKRLT